MLYDEKIEALISAALADGVLTEKEKQVLFKKAQAQGIDLDEFEMVLDARLVELEKAEREKAAAAAPKSTKYGDVRKCPICGAMVPALAGTCPECGYEFSGIDANLSSKQLAEKLEQEAAKWDEKIEKKSGVDVSVKTEQWNLRKNKQNALAQIVRSFPVPNTKADLFEFISMSRSSMLSESTHSILADGYAAKYREAIFKAKSLFASDKMFTLLISEQNDVEKQYQKVHRRQPKIGLSPIVWWIIALVSFMLACLLPVLIWGE